MDFEAFITVLDAKIHEHTGTGDDPIGVIRVSESNALWSGRNGFVDAQDLGVSMVSFALHVGDDVAAQSRFADEMTMENLASMADRIVKFLNDPVAPVPERRRRATDV